MAGAEDEGLAPATRLVGAGRKAEWTGTPSQPGAVVNPPVWRASTHLYANSAALKAGNQSNADGTFFYGRRGAPTQWALADALTALEPGAAGTMLYPSGVAAIAGVLLTVLRPGDHLLMTDNAYEPSRFMARGLLKDFGITTDWFDPLDGAGFDAAIRDNTKAVLIESPGSLTLEVQDVPQLAAIARTRGHHGGARQYLGRLAWFPRAETWRRYCDHEPDQARRRPFGRDAGQRLCGRALVCQVALAGAGAGPGRVPR